MRDFMCLCVLAYVSECVCLCVYICVFPSPLLLLKVLRQWQFIVLLLVWGAGAGLMNSFLTLVPQFLCPFGYDDVREGSRCDSDLAN